MATRTDAARFALAPIITLALLGGCRETDLPEAEALANCFRDATATVNAFDQKDWPTFFKRTYPQVVKAMGGQAAAQRQIEASMLKMKMETGIETMKSKIDPPTKVYSSGAQSFASVPQHLTLSGSGRAIQHDSALIGISNDGGRTWTFVDFAGLRDESLRKELLPNWPDDMPLPN